MSLTHQTADNESVTHLLIPIATLVAATFMTAVGWYVQFVHYPTFKAVRTEDWTSFHRFHSRRPGFLVVPGMLIEGGGAALIAFETTAPMPSVVLAWLGLLAAIFAIGWTFVVSSIIHGALSPAYDDARVAQLIKTNWPRSVAWTLHMIIMVAFLTLR